jgi:hypothetical protein
VAAASAAASSPTVRGWPLATLKAPTTGSGAVRASRLALATSVTWTKSRRWRPSSSTRGGRPAARALRKIAATPE